MNFELKDKKAFILLNTKRKLIKESKFMENLIDSMMTCVYDPSEVNIDELCVKTFLDKYSEAFIQTQLSDPTVRVKDRAKFRKLLKYRRVYYGKINELDSFAERFDRYHLQRLLKKKEELERDINNTKAMFDEIKIMIDNVKF